MPLIAIGCFPPTGFPVVFVAAFTGFAAGLGEVDAVKTIRTTVAYSLIIRGIWLAVAIAGLNALINDIAALAGGC